MTNQPVFTNLYGTTIGAQSTNAFVDHFDTRDPTVNDVSFPVQKKWFNTTSNALWILVGFTTTNGVVTADWEKLTSGNLFETLTGNTGGVVPPTGNNINVVGDGTFVTTTGNAGTSTLTISVTGAITTLYQCDSGTATPMAGTLNVLGGTSVSTSGSGNTITINIPNPLPVNSGGTGDTSFTAYSVVCGGVTSTGALQNVSGLGTSDQVLASNGASALPSWNTTAGGKLVLLSAQIASGSASIIFTGINAYASGLLVISSCQPATNAQVLRMEVSQDNGSTYLNTGYTGFINYTAYNSTTVTNSNSTTIFPISGPVSNAGIYAANIYLNNFNTGNPLCGGGSATWNDTTLATTASGTIGGQTTSGINALRFTFASGNITAGNFTLYAFAPS